MGRFFNCVVFCGQKKWISVYYSIFYSQLFYGCLVWSYFKQNFTDRKQEIQKYCIEVTSFSDSNVQANDLSFELNLLKIVDILKMYLVNLMLAFANKDIPEEPKRLFCRYVSVHYYQTQFKGKRNFSGQGRFLRNKGTFVVVFFLNHYLHEKKNWT